MITRCLTMTTAILTMAMALPALPAGAKPVCPASPVLLSSQAGCVTLVGTWQVQVTPDGGPTFTAFNVFSADGNSTEFDNSGAPSGQTIAVGPWKRTGDHAFQFLEINQLFDPTGAFAGSLEVRANITLSDEGDDFSSRFQFTVRDPNGAVLATGTGSAVGKRVALE